MVTIVKTFTNEETANGRTKAQFFRVQIMCRWCERCWRTGPAALNMHQEYLLEWFLTVAYDTVTPLSGETTAQGLLHCSMLPSAVTWQPGGLQALTRKPASFGSAFVSSTLLLLPLSPSWARFTSVQVHSLCNSTWSYPSLPVCLLIQQLTLKFQGSDEGLSRLVMARMECL